MVRFALKEQDFGVLTEIDVTATLKARLGEEMESSVRDLKDAIRAFIDV